MIQNKTHSSIILEWKLLNNGGSNQTNFTVQIYDEESLCREIETSKKIILIEGKQIFLIKLFV